VTLGNTLTAKPPDRPAGIPAGTVGRFRPRASRSVLASRWSAPTAAADQRAGAAVAVSRGRGTGPVPRAPPARKTRARCGPIGPPARAIFPRPGENPPNPQKKRYAFGGNTRHGTRRCAGRSFGCRRITRLLCDRGRAVHRPKLSPSNSLRKTVLLTHSRAAHSVAPDQRRASGPRVCGRSCALH